MDCHRLKNKLFVSPARRFLSGAAMVVPIGAQFNPRPLRRWPSPLARNPIPVRYAAAALPHDGRRTRIHQLTEYASRCSGVWLPGQGPRHRRWRCLFLLRSLRRCMVALRRAVPPRRGSRLGGGRESCGEIDVLHHRNHRTSHLGSQPQC